jgi:DNA topoisomerase-2
MGAHMIPFAKLRNEERPLIDLAFSKKKADDRKDWLRKFKVVHSFTYSIYYTKANLRQPGTYIDHSVDEITYDDFINRELILFSMADNIRSIPSVVDGLKPTQRKILFGCFKRNLKAEIKVGQHPTLRAFFDSVLSRSLSSWVIFQKRRITIMASSL